MFRSARLRLTLWYLFTIMMVSFFFSIIIYNGATHEFRQVLNQVENRMALPEQEIIPPRPQEGQLSQELGSPALDALDSTKDRAIFRMSERTLLRFRQELSNDFTVVKKRVTQWLLVTNGSIFILAAFGSYFLAGRTLDPIRRTLEKQKTFVADASHELKTPLTALKTTLEVALREPKLTPTDATTILRHSLESVNALQSLSEQLLTAARAEQLDRKLNFQTIDLGILMAKITKGYSSLLKEKRITLTTSLSTPSVVADHQSLEQLLHIFIDNAVKYTRPEGSIHIEAKRKRSGVIITIADSGIGIKKQDTPHIFDRFYRADTSRSKTTVASYGLGLTLAKQIIDSHHGAIGVQSKVDQGTTFTITLPVKQA